jgi:hydrogenase nickel incorporation protein HypA/HybF
MHKLSLMVDLMRKLDTIARAQHPAKIVDVTFKLGALAHVSAQHLREHFVQACRATPLESARLVIEISTDLSEPMPKTLC